MDKAYGYVYPFADSMAEVMSWVQPGGRQRFGYIDRTGKLLIPQIYHSGSAFVDGIAAVTVCGQSGYIGKNGEPGWGIKLRRNSSPPEAPAPSAITSDLLGRRDESHRSTESQSVARFGCMRSRRKEDLVHRGKFDGSNISGTHHQSPRRRNLPDRREAGRSSCNSREVEGKERFGGVCRPAN